MEKISENVSTAFYVRHILGYQLRNIEDGTVILFYTNVGSPWFNSTVEAEEWLKAKERRRLDPDNLNRPNTDWVFEDFFNADVKAVPDRQPLLGTGPLPDWLRGLAGGWSMVALDTYRDNFCLWRCIAVDQGVRPDRSTAMAKRLAKSFFKYEAVPNDTAKTSLDELEKVEKHLNQRVPFSNWLGIREYEPEHVEEGEVVWFLRRSPPEKLTNIMSIGVYEGDAFLIKNIEKLATTFECGNCRARFTNEWNLKRHAERCAEGKTVID